MVHYNHSWFNPITSGKSNGGRYGIDRSSGHHRFVVSDDQWAQGQRQDPNFSCTFKLPLSLPHRVNRSPERDTLPRDICVRSDGKQIIPVTNEWFNPTTFFLRILCVTISIISTCVIIDGDKEVFM